jgi:hypothetical protein
MHKTMATEIAARLSVLWFIVLCVRLTPEYGRAKAYHAGLDVRGYPPGGFMWH